MTGKQLTICSVLLGTELILSSKTIFAQTPPDAGALRQGIEQNQKLLIPTLKPKPAKQPAAEKQKKSPEKAIITVKAFKFSGNEWVSKEQLESVVEPYLNRPLKFSQLREATAAVSSFYRASNWLARASLPKQDITDGIITIQIIEATYGGFELENQDSDRVDPQLVKKLMTGQLQRGERFNTENVERALMLADDIPGINIYGTLQAGQKIGETELNLKMSDEALFSGQLAVDNFGSHATGRERIQAHFNINSPLRRGGLLRGATVNSSGSNYVSVNYSVPFGSQGLRAGINGSFLDYRLTASDFDGLDGEGSFYSYGAETSYPLIRSRKKNLYLLAVFDHKKFQNDLLSFTQSDYDINVVRIDLSGNYLDAYWGGGASSAILSWHIGNISLGSLEGSENEKQEGTYRKVRIRLTRQQVISNDLSFFVSFSGQQKIGVKKLDSSEQFYLGGIWGVRAYPVNEGAGSSGWLTNMELRQRLPKQYVLTGFFDAGHINNSGGASSYGLEGLGLKLSWQNNAGVHLDATWSHRIGNNPNPAPSGKDQDGSLNKNALWFSASYNF